MFGWQVALCVEFEITDRPRLGLGFGTGEVFVVVSAAYVTHFEERKRISYLVS